MERCLLSHLWLHRWGVLDGKNPLNLSARSEVPVLSPSLPWERGVEPYECVVPNVVFVQVFVPRENATQDREHVVASAQWLSLLLSTLLPQSMLRLLPPTPIKYSKPGMKKKKQKLTDYFRVWYGAADAQVGTAVILVEQTVYA